MEEIEGQLPQTSSFEEDFSDLKSFGENETGSLTSKSTIPNIERRKQSHAKSNKNTRYVIKER